MRRIYLDNMAHGTLVMLAWDAAGVPRHIIDEVTGGHWTMYLRMLASKLEEKWPGR